MIASLFQPWAVPVAVLIGCLLPLTLVSRALRLRRRVEFERQVLELLSLATKREQPLLPLLQRAATDAREQERRWLEQIAARLAAGSSLHAALDSGAVGCFPKHVLAAIAAAEGSAQLPAVLDDLSRRQDQARALRYRVMLAASYPALLSMLLLGLGAFWSFSSWSRALADSPRFELGRWIYALAITFGGFWLVLALGWGHGRAVRMVASVVRRLPWLGARLRLLPAARALRAAATLIGSGSSLPAALRLAGTASADARCSHDFYRAAELADRGGSPEQFWPQTGLPTFAVARLLTCRSSSQQLRGQLVELADQCYQRCEDSLQRTVGLLQPVVLLGFGVLVALQFFELFAWLQICRGQAMEQMPW